MQRQGRLYVSSTGSPQLSLGAILEGRCGTSYCLDRCSLPKCCLRFPLLLPAIVMRFILAPSSRRDSGCPLLSLQLFPLRCSSLLFCLHHHLVLLLVVWSSFFVPPKHNSKTIVLLLPLQHTGEYKWKRHPPPIVVVLFVIVAIRWTSNCKFRTHVPHPLHSTPVKDVNIGQSAGEVKADPSDHLQSGRID